MGRSQVQRTGMAGRKPMRSPGRPPPARGVQRAFWRLVADGRTSEEAALACGVSGPVGSRWFRHGGGMPPLSLDEPSSRYLSLEEREEIALLRVLDVGVRQIASGSGAARRRSHGSCVATRRRAVGSSPTGPRSRSAMPSGGRAARRWRSCPVTSGCGSTCRTGWPGRCTTVTGGRSLGRTCRGRDDGTAGARTGAGARPGAQSRSAPGCRSSSLTMLG